jgi:hypothetical protein
MDIYTKAVLTVIAVSLAAIALQNSGLLPAHAAGLASPQAVCGYDLSGRNLDCARVSTGRLWSAYSDLVLMSTMSQFRATVVELLSMGE